MLEEIDLRESTRAAGLALLLFTAAACDRGEAPRGSAPPAASPPAAAHSPAGANRPAAANRLVPEPGAFARAHALDPIDWRPWSGAVLDEAASSGRPVMVISGSIACTGCDVLLGRIAEDEGLVRTINRRFIPVLLDRDERPDVDDSLMQVVLLVTGTGGWPSVIFLEADGRPFDAYSWGAAGGGDKPLRKIVEEVVNKLELGGGTTLERAELLGEKLATRAANDPSGELPGAAAVFASLRGYLAESWNPRDASFGAPPLFPRAPVLDFLLRFHARTGEAEALEMGIAVLTRLQDSPLHDAADGGFFRYAREARWKSPSNEKLLADNAALATVFLDAAQVTGRADLRETARGLADFLLARMRLPGGAFAAALVADRRRAVAVASRQAAAAEASGQAAVGDAPRQVVVGDDPREAAVADVPRETAEEAAAPIAPLRDERVFADANALAISALLRAFAVIGDERYREAARGAAEVLDTKLRRGSVVLHCLQQDGRTCPDGYLDDHALAALAFLDLDESLGAGADARWLGAAREIADGLLARFGHEGTGGFFFSTPEAEPKLFRFKPALDGAHVAGNSAAAMLYVRLAARSGEARDSALAAQTLSAFSEVLTLKPLAAPSMAVALDRFEHRPASNAAP